MILAAASLCLGVDGSYTQTRAGECFIRPAIPTNVRANFMQIFHLRFVYTVRITVFPQLFLAEGLDSPGRVDIKLR
jgi:hypothetical protein